MFSVLPMMPPAFPASHGDCRRSFTLEETLVKTITTLCAAAFMLVANATCIAQTYPSKPIRWILPFAPGGGLDIVSRAVQPQLQASLGQPVVMDNRPSNSGIVAAEAVARSAPDGYTLMTAGNSDLVMNKLLFRKLSYDSERDFAPVIMLAQAPIALFVHESVPAKTLKEFVDYAKANPGKLNYGSAGVGHPFHLALALFEQRTGTQMVHVPYKGSALVIQDIIGGRLHAMVYPATSQMVGLLKEGRLRAIAAATPKRLAALPDTPTFGESGLDNFDVSGWFGVAVPAATPRDIVLRLNHEIGRVIASPEMSATYAKLSMLPGGGTPEQLVQRVRIDLAQWAPVIKALNLSQE
jgi:tripartite-type tricarboxylate transporter receptor subunit TctC